MDRRRLNRTDESASTASLSDSMREFTIDHLRSVKSLFSDAELLSAKPETVLNRMLSTKSYITTNSSLAEENQRAQDDPSQRKFNEIGKGQCGTVYALLGETMTIKLPNGPDKINELFQDAVMHQKVKGAFKRVPSTIRQGIKVPDYRLWVNFESHDFWDVHGPLFHQGSNVPSHGLVTERIYPLPQPVREAVVDALCPKTIRAKKAEFLGKTENKDCLIRLYLGRRNVDRSKMDPSNIKLRNFPLHVDDMERLKLDAGAFAKVMAQALAIMHWAAGVDANDVEFVFGCAPQITELPTLEEFSSAGPDAAAGLYQTDFRHRSVGIWLLDFNQCQAFDEDPAGLKKLVDAFWWNGPYYPRPNSTHQNDKKLWKSFSEEYLTASAILTTSTMPQAFIKGVQERGKKRSGGLFG